MDSSDFQLRAAGDPRLAVHATSPYPAWLWSIDGTRVLWSNPAGARVFGAADAAELAGRTFGPADWHRRQVAQLKWRLPSSGAVRLERLRGFGASLGTLMTCACARLEFADGAPDGHEAVLVTAMEPTVRSIAPRAMPAAPATPDLTPGKKAVHEAGQIEAASVEDIVSPKPERTSAGMVQPLPATEPPPAQRSKPLRFLWQMGTDGRF